MTPSLAEQIVIVAAAALITLLIGGLVLYWISQEWRALRARRQARSEDSAGQQTPNRSDQSAVSNQSPES